MAFQRKQPVRSGPACPIDPQVLTVAGPSDRPVLDALVAHPRGQLALQPTQLDRLLALILGLFPGSRILVALTTRTRAEVLWHRLSQVAVCPIQLFEVTPNRQQARCTVCTFDDVPRLPARYDILLLGDAESAPNTVVQRCLEHLACPRVYRFFPVGQQFDGGQQAWLDQAFGPVLTQVDAAGVRVLFLPSPPFRTKGTWNALERKRKAIWHHKRRNRTIAAVAQALASGDPQAIRQCGLLPEQVAAPVAFPGRREVLILVESVEHGRKLQAYLPGAALLHCAADGPANPEDERDGTQPLIVTSSFTAQYWVEGDVLLRATGERGGVAVNRADPPQRLTVERDCLLLDLDDRWDRRAEVDTEDRRRLYRAWGWQLEALQVAQL